MLEKYPRFKKGEIEKIYKKLPIQEKKFIEDYIFYRKANGLNAQAKINDTRKFIIQLIYVLGGSIKNCDTLDKANRLSVLIKESNYKPNTIHGNLIDTGNVLKYTFDDWSSRFKGDNKKGIRCFSNFKNKSNGEMKEIPDDEEVKNLLKTETKTFWKTFLLAELDSKNRIIEIRTYENEKIKFQKDGTSIVEVYMTKVNKTKFNFLSVQTTDYIKKLQEEQKNEKMFGRYLFHSPNKPDNPISKNAVDGWFKKLSFKAIGKYYTPYSLRHYGATKLYNLAKRNLIAESTALKLLGHSKSMMGTYDHTATEEEIEILKEQNFNMDISPEKKHELQIKYEEIKKEIEQMKKDKIETDEKIKNMKEIQQKVKSEGQKEMYSVIEHLDRLEKYLKLKR